MNGSGLYLINFVLLFSVKKVFHKILSLSLALLVLVSTLSFTVEKHFCGKILVDSSVFSEAKKCPMGMHQQHGESSQVIPSDCCNDQKIAVEGQEELKLNFQDLNFEQQLFLSSFTYTYFNIFTGIPEQVIPFKDYSPPLLVTDIHLVDQVFLI